MSEANSSTDQNREELENNFAQILNRLTNVEQGSGGGDGGIEEKWHQTDHYGPTEPLGDHHNSPAGIVINPKEPIQLHEATIDSDSAGTLIVRVFAQTEDGGQGYPDNPLGEYRFNVTEGVQTIEFDGLELTPLPDKYTGYSFSINDSDVDLRRSSDITTPIDIEIADIHGASAASGSVFSNYYHLFDLKISSDRTDRPLHTDNGSVSAEFDRINNTHKLKPPIRDWGAEVQRLVDNARPGDLIEFGPGTYITDTPVTIDKPLAILGRGANSDLRDPTGPVIYPTGDFPILECTDGVGLRTGGYHLRGEGAETGPGVVVHGRSVIKNITGDSWNDHLIHLSQDSEHDNLNSSRVSNVAGRGVDGGVVAATRTTRSARELNALNIDVRMSFSSDYGIFADSGFGNFYHIQQAEGTHETALHMNSQRSLGMVTYCEGGTKPVIDFQDSMNTGFIIHAGERTPYEEMFVGSSNNLQIQLARNDDPFISRGYGTVDFGGGSIEVREPGRGVIYTSDDGTRWRQTVDNNGNPQYEEL